MVRNERGGKSMSEQNKFLYAKDVAMLLGNISISHAYKIMRDLNNELKAANKITISGRVSRKYFFERFYA